MKMFIMEPQVQKRDILFTGINIKSISVLLAEDNDLNAEVISTQLEQLGMKVTRAANGKEAVECFRESDVDAFDVILMDLLMPEMNGYEAAHAIRGLQDHARARTIPIIAMTANAFAGDERTSLDAGMNGYIEKPMAMEEVATTIVRTIN